jgi:hypothetical protein
MRAGALDRTIRVEQLVEGTASASGEKPRTAVSMGSFWVEILDRRAMERFLGQQFVAELEVGWRTRWSQRLVDVLGPGELVQVVHEGRTYDVIGIFEPPATRHQELIIRAKARAE